MSDIKVAGLRVSYGDKKVFDGFDAVFPEGRLTCVMGPSGCGKTTLLRVLMGFLVPDAGTVESVPRKKSAVFQEDRLSEDFSVLSNIRMVTGKRVSRETIAAHLGELGLGSELLTPVRELSGGMKRRAAIARAVLFGGDAVFLDEAFKGLDEGTKTLTMDYFLRHTAGKTVVAVTHDPEEAVYMKGRVLRLGDPEGTEKEEE